VPNTTVSYDRLQTTTFDDQLRVTRTTTDVLGRIVRSEHRTDGNLFIPTDYTYGALGLPTAVTRRDRNGGNARPVTLSYDALGRRTFLRDPNLGGRGTFYNAFGEVRLEQDGNGKSTFYDHDALGRVTSKSDNDGTTPADPLVGEADRARPENAG